MKSYMAKPGSVPHKWYVVDADGKVFGRVASQVAAVLRGKNKPEFTPNVDTGDYVIIINVEKSVFTGNKLKEKLFRSHSGYVGHMKETTYEKLMQKKPEFVMYEAVRRMLPKNRLGRQMLKKLRVYKGPEHEHAAQKPEVLQVEG